jgi:hypothetical protein
VRNPQRSGELVDQIAMPDRPAPTAAPSDPVLRQSALRLLIAAEASPQLPLSLLLSPSLDLVDGGAGLAVSNAAR